MLLNEELATEHTNICLQELNALAAFVEDTHTAFLKKHAYVESIWPVALTDHEYFAWADFSHGCQTYSSFKRSAARIRSSLTELRTHHTITRSSAATKLRRNSSSSSTSYICDCCNGSHFIVMCTYFRELNSVDRYIIAAEKQLFFNCKGRHNRRSIKSSIRCKQCSGHHHTMLYEFYSLAAAE